MGRAESWRIIESGDAVRRGTTCTLFGLASPLFLNKRRKEKVQPVPFSVIMSGENLLMITVALLAGWLPAARAAGIDPNALRQG
jgi:hypothetical protein